MFESLTQPRKQLILKSLPWIIICFGIILRFLQYIPDNSLWLDESCLSLNIVNRSFSELLEPLDYAQAAPVGFLVIEKFMVQTFGDSEHILRMFPFICGIISIFLFYFIAGHTVKKEAVIIALGLFSLSATLINHSAEVKQYSSDVAVGLMLYAATIYFLSLNPKTVYIAFFGAAGAAAVWISYPSVFILAGIGISLASFYLVKREWANIARISAVCLVWLLSFIAFYSVSLLGSSTVVKEMQTDWNLAFMPFFPSSVADFKWFFTSFFSIFKNPAGFLFLPGIAAFAFLTGSVSMFLKNRRWFFILLSPVLIALLASGFHLYPFWQRLLLFTVPSLLLFIADGAEYLREKISHGSAKIGIILIGLLFFYPVLYAGHNLVLNDVYRISPVEDIKPVMLYIREHKRDGDILHVYQHSQCAFEYYAERFGFTPLEGKPRLNFLTGFAGNGGYIENVSSKRGWEDFARHIDGLRGNKRVWLVFSHVDGKEAQEKKFYLYYLDSIGEKLDHFKSDGAEVYLYDLG